jgi:hypothetical protein
MSTQSLNYTYIYFDVRDYTNSNVLTSYTLGNTPLTFIPDFTTSNILSGAQNISSKTLRWEFGDGAYSNELSPTHYYQWPGEYNVTLTVYDGSGNAYDSTFSSTVQIYDFIATQISFQDYKSLIYDIPVGQLIDPLIINTYFSWQNYQTLSATGYTINLYASGAKGAYNYVTREQNDKWAHLRSLSRFYTLSTINGNQDYVTIESIQPTITPIYVNIQNNQLQPCNSTDPGNVLAGVTGSCQFWYTDDIPANLLSESNPIIIFASIDNSKFEDAFTQRTNVYDYISYPPYGYQNIDPAVFPDIKTRYNPANHLSITTTGIDGEGDLIPPSLSFNIPYSSWQDTEVPYVIKFKDNINFTTKNYPPLSSSIANPSIAPQSAYDVHTGIVYVSGYGVVPLSSTVLVPVNDVTFYEDFPAQAPQSLGAFYKGYFIAQQSTENCYLTASVNVIDPPYYKKDALVNWITIPQYNSALQIIKQENYNGYNNLLTIAFTNNSLFPTSSNNTYAITVAPSGTNAANDYQTWFADPINDQILKYDIYGNLVTSYSLLSAITLVNNLTTIQNFQTPATNGILPHATPSDMALDGNNNLWVTLFDSGSVIKFDASTGYVTAIATPSGSITTASNFFPTLSSDYNSLSGFAGESLLLPSSIDTDIDNNIWVAYTHPDASAIVKYQGSNNLTIAAAQLTAIPFPSGITPEQLQIDRNGYVWATAINHNTNGVGFNNRNDYLYKFDSNGNLLPGYPLSGFNQIGNITIDGNQNAWVVQGAETLTKIDGVSGTTTNYIAGLGNNQTNYICSVGGLTCDTSNNIWVINNFDNRVYVIDANLPSTGALNAKYNIPLAYPTPSLPPVTGYPLDADAAAYITRAGVTDRLAQNQIDQFVRGIKNLGLWDYMVAWPMAQKLNAGSGSTVYSIGGYKTADGTMNGSATWTPNGITFTGSNDYIDYGTFNVNISAGGFSVHALISGLGCPPIYPDGVDQFNIFKSVNDNFSLHMTSGVAGIGTWEIQAEAFNPNIRYFDYEDRSQDLTKDMAISWIADYLKQPSQIANIFQYNGITTKNVGTQLSNNNGQNGTYTMQTVGRNNSYNYPYKYTQNSRISYLLAFAPGINMTSQTMSAVYTLCQNTLNRVDQDAMAYIARAGITDRVAPVPNTYSDGLQEFQAYGDWNGYNWLNKYASPTSTIRTITGTSNLFNIYPATGQFNIAKINENWNASGYYDSLRFQETLLDKQVFFDQFLGVILGNMDAQPYELGKTVYEKIANFVDNNADIDKVNINELLSFCTELSIEFDQYNVVFPPQLRRLVDLLSIKQSKLWGTTNKYGTNFDPRGTIFPNNTYGINLSSIIDPLTGTFINGVPIVAQETFSGNYKVVNTNLINNYNIGDIIPLSAYTSNWGWGLVAPDITGYQINNYYSFYVYNPVYSNAHYDNIIDWNDPYTTLVPTNSAYADWSSDNGIVQSLLSYEITKGFRLFTSAANITYNN